MMGIDYELCKSCQYATWDSYEGYSAKECGIPNSTQSFIDGCRKDCQPYYDDQEECWTCNPYKMLVEVDQ